VVGGRRWRLLGPVACHSRELAFINHRYRLADVLNIAQ
jgi:hypothetical protein